MGHNVQETIVKRKAPDTSVLIIREKGYYWITVNWLENNNPIIGYWTEDYWQFIRGESDDDGVTVLSPQLIEPSD